MPPGELPGGGRRQLCQLGVIKPPWPRRDPRAWSSGGVLVGAVFREATFAFAQSWPSRRLPCLAALADTQEGKTAWPWQLPARKEPTGGREKPLPCRDPLQQPR